MAILNHGSTLRTADGGQTTTTIVTAANIGTYGVATNSTYYVGTTQNIFNRASGAQTLTGVSIDGNAATVTNGLTTGNYNSYALPLAGGTMTGNLTITKASAYLYLNGTNSDSELRFLANSSDRWAMGMNVGDATENLNIYNYTTATTNFTILKASGNVGVGTASPSYKLDVSGAINASTYVYAGVFYDNDNTVYYTNPSGTSNLVGLTVANTITGSVSGSSASCTGNAATATTSALLTSSDVRTISPSSANASRLTYGFTSYSNNNTGSWADYLHLRSYADSSGGNDNLIMFNKSVIGMRIWQQAFGSATAYATYKDVAFTDQGFYIGTTSVAINRSSASQTLTGVSIDGNAATATNGLTTSNYVSYSAFTASLTSTVDARAPIFYDSNNTAYYIDGASGSKLKYLQIDGDWGSSPFGSGHESFTIRSTYASMVQRQTNGALAYWLHHIAGDGAYNLYGGRGATDGSSWDWAYRAYPSQDGNYVEFNTSARAQIFYDRNDTAYYLDPANSGTSLLVAGKVGIGTTSPGAPLEVSGTSGDSLPTFKVTSTTAPNSFNYAGTILNSSLGAGRNYVLFIGKASSTKNAAYIGYNHSGTDGSNTNFLTLGHYASDNLLNILGNGNVGIGTTSPSLISGYVGLNVVNAGYTQIKLQSSASSAGIEFKPSSGNNWELQANTSSQWFVFDRTQDVYRLLINSSGNVGIGTASPSQKLHVVGTAYSDTDFRAPIFYDSNDTGYFLNPNSTSNLNNLRAATISAANHGLTCVYYGGGATPTNGYLITTNIDYSTFNMPTVIIEGYAYGSAAPIHLEIVWYAYNNSWTNLSYTNLGAWDVGTISIGTNASGKVCLHLSNLIYYGRFNIRCIYDGGNAPLEGWTVTDATTSALTRVTTISKSAIVTSITGNSATTTLATKATRANGDFYIDDNYGNTVVGVYSASRYQGVYAMGDSYKLAADGSTTGSLYGIAWSHPNAGGAAGNLSNHGALILINGGYAAAISSSIRCTVDMRTPIYYDSNDTAYYLDPASTSNLNNVTAAGTLTVTNIAKNSTSPIVINSGLSASLGLRVYYDMNLYNTLTFTDSAWNSQGAISGSASVVNITAATATTSFTKYAGYSQEGGSFRAPIFYDSDNTAYYVDPTSTSSVNVVGTNKIRADTNRNFGDDLGWWAHDPYGYGWGKPHGSFRSLEVSSSGNFDTEPALFRIHQWGSGAAEFWKPKGTTLYLRETPGGGGGWFTRFYLEGYGETNGSWRAPIFYDSNNTAYYINPAGNSIVSSLTFDSNITIYKHNDRNLLIQGGGGTDAGLLGRGSSGQFAFQVYGNGSGSYGFLDGAWAGWDIRKVVDGDLFLNDNATYYLNPASTTNLNNLTVAGDVRSPIFYDSNNTAYYLDPASNSVLNGLYVNAYYNLSNDYKDIYVYGDVNTYYVVLIQGEYIYSFGRYSVTRGYNWTGPDTWNTASHKGGLTLDWEWSGDTAWGGNDKAIRIIEFNESYSTMVAGLGYPVNGGVIIWLRGGGVGGAQYRIRTPIGSNTTVTAYDGVSATNHSSSTTFTAADSTVFSTRANVSNVSAEILARYPVRNAGSLYNDGNLVVDTGSSTQTKSGIFASAASVRAPIFYDTDNTAYYVDPNSTTSLRTVGSWRSDSSTWDGEFSGKIQYHSNHWYFQSGDLWIFRNSGGTNVATINQSGVISAAFSGSLTGNVTGNVTGTAINIAGNGAGYDTYGTIGVTEPAGASNYSYYGLTRQSNIGCGFGLTGTTGALGLGANAFWFGSATSTAAGVMGSAYIAFNGSNLVAVGTADATQFRDKDDTTYYVDPAGTSNLNQWTTLTAARLGRSRYWTNRVAYNADANYHTGTNGWSTDEGTWANAWKGGFSGWDIWGYNMDHPQGAGYVHAQGIVSGLHASTTDGGSAYGWMMVGAHAATDNRYWLRGKWAGSTSGWVEMLTSGNYNNFTLKSLGNVDNFDFNTYGNYNMNMVSGYIASSPNKPTNYSYSYGTVISFSMPGSPGQAQFYVSHAGNDLCFRGGWNGSSWQTWNKCLTDINSPYAWAMNQNVGTGNSPTFSVVDATQFRDSNNTAYYIDAGSTSYLYVLSVASAATAADYYTAGWFRSSTSGNGMYNQVTGQHFYSDSANYWNVASSASEQGIRLRTGGHAGTVRGYFYADTNNDVGLLNQAGSWRVRVVGGDYVLFDGSSIRAQIFYDSNDTGYYTDPAGTSILNVVRANSYVQKSASQSLSGTVGCTIDVAAAGIHVLTLAASTTISSFTYNYRAPNPSVNTIMLVIKYGGTASITWTNVLWANGVTPTITGVSGYADVYMLTSYQGTTGVWIGTVVSQGVVSTSL